MPMSESSSVFGRRPSLFSGKKRKGSAATITAITAPSTLAAATTSTNASGVATPNTTISISPSPPVTLDETSPPDRRGRESSIASLPASVIESANTNKLHRSHSFASNESVSSSKRRKSRAPSIANISAHSPINLHRVTRSFSANASQAGHKFGSISSISPQKSYENLLTSESQPRTPFGMLATPFGHSHSHHGHGIKRQDTAMSYTSKPSISNESGIAATASNPTIIFNNISETSNKRISTLGYLRKVHEGQTFYFNTLQYSPTNLSRMASLMPSKIGRRATNYLLLGTSIPPLLDCNTGNPLEYLSALYSVLAEFETFQNSDGSAVGARGRMGQMFKSGMRMRTGRRSSAATIDTMYTMDADHSSSSTTIDALPLPHISSHGHHLDFSYLQTPSLPFEPDFATSFASLMDILVDTYENLMQLIPGPEVCSPALYEAFTKADKMIRKILVQNVVQEFGETTRKEVKSEVAGLGKVVLSGLM